MKISEKQLRNIIKEVILETISNDELNEGKLGRALGAAALGGALMFGHPQQANAQLRNVRVQSEMPQEPTKPSGEISNNLSIVSSDIYFAYLSYRNGLKGISFGLGPFRSAFVTLNDLNQLLIDRTEPIIADDYSGHDFKISYEAEQNALKISSQSARSFDHSFYLTEQDIKKVIKIIEEYKQWNTEYLR